MDNVSEYASVGTERLKEMAAEEEASFASYKSVAERAVEQMEACSRRYDAIMDEIDRRNNG